MAVFLSPGVFPREIDLSQLPTATGPLRPAFIGTAKKGPLNKAVYVSSAAQFIEIFGEPFPESYLGYSVLGSMQENNQCYAMRVGVEKRPGQVAELADIAIDTSGAKIEGWGRVPLYTGIDYGRINLRVVNEDKPVSFHVASFSTPEYNDAELSDTDGATTATLDFQSPTSYTGTTEETYVMVITGPPTSGNRLAGATYQVVKNSDGSIVASGAFVVSSGPQSAPSPQASPNPQSDYISLGSGISARVTLTAGNIDINDTFVFKAFPNNKVFSISVEGDTPEDVTMGNTTYTSVGTMVDAINAAAVTAYGSSTPPFIFIAYTTEDGTVVPQVRTKIAGRRIQILGTGAFAQELGVQQYQWDIPRSHLLGLEAGPFQITTANNRVALNVVGSTQTKSMVFSLPVGQHTASSLAAIAHTAGIVSGERFFDAISMTLTDGLEHLVFLATLNGGLGDHSLDMLQLLANYSQLKTLRFSEEVNIPFPYKRGYRGYFDGRVSLPAGSEDDPAIPDSCSNPSSDECAADTAYYAGIVGWLVAPSAGTWLEGYTVSLEVATGVVGDSSGRYNLIVKDASGVVVDTVQDCSFDQTATRYIGNLVNPGMALAGTNGSPYVNWEPRPNYLDNDPTGVSGDYVVRLPSPFNGRKFVGMANGIPIDPAYSTELDSAVLGNPAESTGLYAFQNPEAIDINLLATPGFSSGAVIGQALTMCESRGDVLYLIDPPFGLRPQQVVDWHNGMLLSDLRAAINSSYGALYWSWLRTQDQFSGNEIWVPPSGQVAAIFSRTARVAEQWTAPAGTRRGRITWAIDVEYSPSLPERDLLYGSGNAVNSIVKFPQKGIVLWGDRTLQRSSSALDRVPVRMLLIEIKKNMTNLLQDFVYEANDSILWKQVEATLNPYLADIAARRGLLGFKVVCDSSNNTPERQDRNELWVSVFLKPTKTAEFIALNLAVLRSSGSFTATETLISGGVVVG